ncbi:MAG: hypothetical protein KDI16_04080 [Halioglobus sp.]|nr:hypothetical protein [Halioglobus sp.]
MKRIVAMGSTLLLAGAVLAGDEQMCLDCHEPADDWQGMTREQLMADARDPDNRRHRDIQALSDEQLAAIFDALLSK